MGLKARNFARRIGNTKAADGRHQADKVWKAMRILRRFTVADVAAVVDSSNVENVQRYARQLEIAGFLRVQRMPGSQLSSYSLIRDSGPIAPSIVRYRTAVYDHNTDLEYPLNANA